MKKFIAGFLLVGILSGTFSSCAGTRGTHVGDCPSHDKNYFLRR